MKTHKTTLLSTFAAAAIAIALPSSATEHADMQADVAQLEQLQRQATGAAFSAGSNEFRVIPGARAEKVSAPDNTVSAPSDMQIGPYRVELAAPIAAFSARSLRSAAASLQASPERAVLAVSDSGMPTVVTSSLTVFFDEPDALQQAARASGGTVVYSSAKAGMGAIEFGSVAQMLEALSRVQGIAGIRSAEPELVQGTLEPM